MHSIVITHNIISVIRFPQTLDNFYRFDFNHQEDKNGIRKS